MKIYKVELEIDTGYEFLDRVCVLFAENAEDAQKKADRYYNSRLQGEKFANVKSVTEVTNENGIIYQDYFKRD